MNFMKSKRSKKIELSQEDKRDYLEEIISYFKNERNEKIGLVAAEDILDFFMDIIGDKIYKKAANLHKIAEEYHKDGFPNLAEQTHNKAERYRQKAREIKATL